MSRCHPEQSEGSFLLVFDSIKFHGQIFIRRGPEAHFHLLHCGLAGGQRLGDFVGAEEAAAQRFDVRRKFAGDVFAQHEDLDDVIGELDLAHVAAVIVVQRDYPRCPDGHAGLLEDLLDGVLPNGLAFRRA